MALQNTPAGHPTHHLILEKRDRVATCPRRPPILTKFAKGNKPACLAGFRDMLLMAFMIFDFHGHVSSFRILNTSQRLCRFLRRGRSALRSQSPQGQHPEKWSTMVHHGPPGERSEPKTQRYMRKNKENLGFQL